MCHEKVFYPPPGDMPWTVIDSARRRPWDRPLKGLGQGDRTLESARGGSGIPHGLNLRVSEPTLSLHLRETYSWGGVR